MAPPVLITRMHERDLPAVMAIEEVSFPTPWSVNTYRYEVTRNELGRYYVVRPTPDWAQQTPAILAYGGFWKIDASAHVTTIATHPEWRRLHLGAWLMLSMMQEAATMALDAVTLEVRASNDAAKALYRDLGFAEVGRRRRYYPPTKTRAAEDALLMTIDKLQRPETRQRLAAQRATVEAAVADAMHRRRVT